MEIELPAVKYINPLVDFAFKKIFGTEPNKDLLIAFLNEALRGHRRIVDLVYNQNEHPGELQSEGTAVFDLLCTGDQGEQFLIEVQRGKQENFKQRALFYTSRLISDQAPKGNRRKWKYNLKEVYMIALLEETLLENSPADNFIQDICLCNRQSGKIFYDKLSYTYIELLKFEKKEHELITDLDKWLYVLKNMSQMNELPNYLNKPVFKKLFDIAEYSKFTKEEKRMYNRSQKYRWDNENVLDYARKEGLEEGREQGREQGREKGLQEGLIEAKRGMQNVVIELKKRNWSIQDIAKITQLSIEEIAAL